MQTNTSLAGLAILLAIPTSVTLCSESRSFTEYDSIPRLFEGFVADNVRFVVLSKAKSDATPPPADPTSAEEPQAQREVLTLMRSGDDGWVIGDGELAGVPVRDSAVQTDVLDHVQAIRRDERTLVAAGAEADVLAERGVTDADGILVSCRNAENVPVAELYLGKDAAADGGVNAVRGFFVRKKDTNDIVLYENQSYWNLNLKPESWIDTRIQQLQTDDVVSFALHNPKGKVAFSREPKKEGEAANVTRNWKVGSAPEGVGTPRQDEINNLLSRFAYINVQRYIGHVGQLRDPDLARRIPEAGNATFEVKAVLADGTTHTMWVGEKVPEKNEYYARFDGPKAETKNFLVAVGDWVVTGFEKDPKDLFEPKPAAAAESPTGGAGEPGESEGGEARAGKQAGGEEASAPEGAKPEGGQPEANKPEGGQPEAGEAGGGEPPPEAAEPGGEAPAEEGAGQAAGADGAAGDRG
jgi:hypothetical protein